MRQAIHIFRKDVRSLWLPIALVLSATFAFAAVDAAAETEPSMFLSLLLMVSRLLLVAAAVYREQLAGDRQFWITRPYSWRSLVAAKALLILTFINLPLLALDLAVSVAHGLQPSLMPIAIRQVLLLGAVLIPVAAMAACASNMGQLPIAIVGCLLVLSWLNQGRNSVQNWSRLDWIQVSFAVVILTIAGSAAFVLQYAQRRTWRSRAIVALGLGCSLITFTSPPTSLAATLKTSITEPAVLGSTHLALDPLSVRQSAATQALDYDFMVQIAGLPPRTEAELDGIAVEIQPTGRASWHSEWKIGWKSLESVSRSLCRWASVRDDAGERRVLSFTLDPNVLPGFQDRPVTLRISTLLTIFDDVGSVDLSHVNQWVTVPGLGRCILPAFTNNIECVALDHTGARFQLNRASSFEAAGRWRIWQSSPLYRCSLWINPTVVQPVSIKGQQRLGTIRRDLELKQIRIRPLQRRG